MSDGDGLTRIPVSDETFAVLKEGKKASGRTWDGYLRNLEESKFDGEADHPDAELAARFEWAAERLESAADILGDE